MNQTALFVNFTDQEFIGYWDGKGRKYPAGSSEYMPDYLARHYAKHLVNRELLRTNPDGSLIYPNGDKMTSPKNIDDAPLFRDLFYKAYIPDNFDDAGEQTDSLESLIQSANKNRAAKLAKAKIEDAPPLSRPRKPKPQEDKNFTRETSEDGVGPQIVLPPDWNDDGEESEFKGSPKE